MKLQFTPNLKILLFAALALPLLLALGTWQVQRGFEKRALEQQYERQQAAPPVEMTDRTVDDLPLFTRVIARGEFDPERFWLLDNKHRSGRVGYEVIVPFQLDDGRWLLVNRGWLAAGGSRRQLPEVPAVPGEVTLFAQIAPDSRHPLLSAAHPGPDWPRMVTALEVEEMAQQLAQPLLSVSLRLDAASPGALVTGWSATAVESHRHWGYALQWFGLALALLVWLFYVCMSRVDE